MSTQTRTARFEIEQAATKGGWTKQVNPWNDIFYERFYEQINGRKQRQQLMVRFTDAGAISLLAYNGAGSCLIGDHEIRSEKRRKAVEILHHDCERFDYQGCFCTICDQYSK